MAKPIRARFDRFVKSISEALTRDELDDEELDELDEEIDVLNFQADRQLVEIGRQAVEKLGADEFGEAGAEYAAIKEKLDKAMAAKQEILDAREAERLALEEARRQAEEDIRSGAARSSVAARSSNKTLKCPICGTLNESGIKFCGECGAKLNVEQPKEIICQVCGFENAPGTKFCGECGARLDVPIVRPKLAVDMAEDDDIDDDEDFED